jgi:hypothetical protein
MGILLLLSLSNARDIPPLFRLHASGLVSDFVVDGDRLYAATDMGSVDIFDLRTRNCTPSGWSDAVMNAQRFVKSDAAVAFLLLALIVAVPSVTAEEATGIEAPADRSLFPKAYGILASEHLMHPVDMSDWPVKIDRTRQLFVDE